MGHADDDTVHTFRAGDVDDTLQSGNQNFATFQTEALFRRPFLGEEILQSVSKTKKNAMEATLLQTPFETALFICCFVRFVGNGFTRQSG